MAFRDALDRHLRGLGLLAAVCSSRLDVDAHARLHVHRLVARVGVEGWAPRCGRPAGGRIGHPQVLRSRFTEPLLRDLGVRDCFEIVVSGDTLPLRKPDPLPLLHAAKHFGVKPGDAPMVGDSVSDVKAARAAGFAIVCMSCGYNHGVDTRPANPDAVMDSLAEFRGLLQRDARRWTGGEPVHSV